MANYTFPENLKYTKEHEWVQKTENGLFRIGVTEYAAGSMGDVTFVELPELDDELEEGDTPCVIETVKSSEDVFAPVSGTVAAVNEALEDTPELVNSDCYGDGWLFEVKSEDESEFDKLMDAKEYTEYVESLDE